MFHRIIMVGNLGRDPEMRYVASGQAVVSMSVAVNSQYTNSAGTVVKQTTWFRVTVWGKTAEACSKYLRKGSSVLVEGTLQPDQNTGGPRVWTSKSGSVGASYDVLASTVRFLSRKDDDGSDNGSLDQALSAVDQYYEGSEELPF